MQVERDVADIYNSPKPAAKDAFTENGTSMKVSPTT